MLGVICRTTIPDDEKLTPKVVTDLAWVHAELSRADEEVEHGHPDVLHSKLKFQNLGQVVTA